MPKISVIIPTYNSNLFLKRAIDSVLNQTFKDWELLIINDCSTDKTVKLVNEFIKQDKRIRLFKTSINSGSPAVPKNIGIENAKGEYVAFLDHDDEWMPEKLEKQLKVFKESKSKKLGLVSCFLKIKDHDTYKIVGKRDSLYKENVLENLIKSNFIITSSCVMTKLSILREVGNFDINFKFSDDWDMWVRISMAGYDFDYVPEYLLNYFVHDNNACYHNSNLNKRNEFALFYEKYKELFLKYSYYGAGCYYFAMKNKTESIKYFTKFLFSKKSTNEEKIKSCAYIVLNILPFLENSIKKLWWKIQ